MPLVTRMKAVEVTSLTAKLVCLELPYKCTKSISVEWYKQAVVNTHTAGVRL